MFWSVSLLLLLKKNKKLYVAKAYWLYEFGLYHHTIVPVCLEFGYLFLTQND
jgi:hypothetical protein